MEARRDGDTEVARGVQAGSRCGMHADRRMEGCEVLVGLSFG